ncbi:MAG: beta-glucanase (GH16 family) [Flavobacteriales bacterium]|jgi:beta-glucanase (GH16 family)
MSFTRPRKTALRCLTSRKPLIVLSSLLAAWSPFCLAQQTPYTGSAVTVPNTVQAENFDFGGQNVAYNDTTAVNIGNAYRQSEGVDLEVRSGGGHNVGWTSPGEWYEYTINVSAAGTYNISANIASALNGGSLRFEFSGATNANSANVSFDGTQGWQNWAPTGATSVVLNSGQHVVRMFVVSGAYNVDSFSMTYSGQSPFLGAPAALPGTVQTEDFDNGGQNVAYNDTTSNNIPNQYRTSEGVDIGGASHGGYAVGYAEPGEWLEYSVDVTAAGTYDISGLMASDMSGGSVSFSFSGATNVNSSAVSIGYTGGWDTWSPSSSTSVILNQGAHIVRLNFVSGTLNISDFTVSASGGSGGLPTAYSGYTGNYNGYSLKYDDRFDSLNSAIWEKGDGAVGLESDCRFTPQGVQVAGGNLELVVRNEFVPSSWSNNHQAHKSAYNYSCGELRTVPAKRIKYGRIETRMKVPNRSTASGYISSLFTYVNEGSPQEWEEIDVELEGGRPDKFQANLIYGFNAPDWNATRNWGAWEHKIDIAPADQWRVYAIEWTPTAIKWFVDGLLVKTLSQEWTDCNPGCIWPQIHATPTPDNLTELMMNFWIPNDVVQNNFGGNKSGNVYPMTAQYDWLRIYELNSHPLTNW